MSQTTKVSLRNSNLPPLRGLIPPETQSKTEKQSSDVLFLSFSLPAWSTLEESLQTTLDLLAVLLNKIKPLNAKRFEGRKNLDQTKLLKY
jgi:hypothetical protein